MVVISSEGPLSLQNWTVTVNYGVEAVAAAYEPSRVFGGQLCLGDSR